VALDQLHRQEVDGDRPVRAGLARVRPDDELGGRGVRRLRDPGDDLATQRGWVAGARVLELWGGVEPVGTDRVRLWATAVVSLPGGGRTELACARTAPAV
jgi:hypothetical protein